MSGKKPVLDKLTSWPHAEGLVRLSYMPNGKFMYTGGSESYIRVYDPTADVYDEPELLEFCSEAVTSVHASNDYYVSAEEDGGIALHSHSEKHELVKLLTRTGLTPRSARFDPKGKRVAVTSDELIVKVVEVEDPLNIVLLSGHTKGVREATWCPDGTLLTTSGSDGTIRVWDLSVGNEATCIKVIDGIIAAAEPESRFGCQAVWHPSGKYFVVATRTDEIAIISRDSWTKIGTFSEDGHTKAVSELAWSANGNYLASAGSDDQVIVWNTATRLVVNRMGQDNGIVTGIGFQPSPFSNTLAWVTATGQITRWFEPVPNALPGPSDFVSPTTTKEREGSIALSEELEDDGLGEYNPLGGVMDDWIDDDDVAGYAEPEPVEKSIEKANNWSSNQAVVRSQHSFQPGSTPVKDDRRYLSFNMLGVIHLVERKDFNIITVEFHDRERTGNHFNDHFRFSMGALSELGSVFACAATADSASLISYKPFDSWADTSEWQYSLPSEESATMIAVGGMSEPSSIARLSIAGTGTIVVATDKGFLRFLTGSGIQKYVWNLGEEVISMAAGKDWVLVIYESGNGLGYQLLDTDSFEIVQIGKIPTAKGVDLVWCGFTDEDIPCIYDSNGLVSLLDRSRRPRQGRWVPALDTTSLARKEGKQESYWPIGVTEKFAHVIILKGSTQYPGFPTPLPMELELKFPLLRLDVVQGSLEEAYLRENTFLSHRRDGADPTNYDFKNQIAKQEVEIDKHLLKIIQTACKADKLSAALDAALLLTQPASLQAAVKIAAFFRLPALEDRIEMVMKAKNDVREEDDEKRNGKWSHLVDDRHIMGLPNFGSNQASQMRTKRTLELYGAPDSSAIHSTGRSTVISRTGESRNDDVDYSSAGEEMMIDRVEENESREEEGGMEEKPRSLSREVESDIPAISSPEKPKKGTNPFAKKAATVRAPPSAPINPFSSKSIPAQGVKSTGSFFGRVHGVPEPAKTNGKVSKQTNVFGSAKVPAVPKKRKSDVAEDGDETSKGMKGAKAKKGEEKGLVKLSFGKSSVSKSVVEESETQEDEEMEETQLESTQVETQESTRALSPKKSEPGSGLSKLAVFAAMAKSKKTEMETEVVEREEAVEESLTAVDLSAVTEQIEKVGEESIEGAVAGIEV